MSDFGFQQKSFQSRRTSIAFFFMLFAVLLVWTILFSPDLGGFISARPSTELRVDFVNIGQGDGVLVVTPMGRTYLIDGGTHVPSSQARRQNRELMHNYLRDNGITSLDGIVVTHWHNDHIGGINQVLNLYETKKIWEIPGDFTTSAYDSYVRITGERNVERIVVTAGDVLDWGEDIFVQVIHPYREITGNTSTDMNNMSVVLLLRYGEVQVMLTGDIEEEAQREIVKYGDAIKSQIVKVPHHGSTTSDYRPFLNLVSPKYAIIQVGRNNPFRHPSQDVIELYREMGTRIYRNDIHGNIRLFIGGENSEDFRIEVDQRL